MTDKQLIKAISRNNDLAFSTLIKKYQKLVFTTSYRIVNNILDAEDISQEVFLEAFRSVHYLREEENLPGWLYRVAYNRSISFLRKHNPANTSRSKELSQSHTEDSAILVTDNADCPVRKLEIEESKRVLLSAINRLPENQKTALLMHKMEGLSYKEICLQMQLSIASIESLIYRAKLNLRKLLIQYFKNQKF
jgi:RNA polymerase sigma-70 factor (ECF subfamily)